MAAGKLVLRVPTSAGQQVMDTSRTIRPMRRWPLRTLAMLLLCATGLALLACTPPQSTRPILSETPTPLIAGQKLVTPIDRSGAMWDGRALGDPPPLVFSDGQRAPTTMATFARRQDADPDTWLPSPGSWTSATAQTDASVAMLVADIPDTALGQSVWMDGRRVPASWIVSGFRAPPRPKPIALDLTPAQKEAALELARPELENPLLRWRAVLALERLGIQPPPLDGALTRDWADQWARRADGAWIRLHAADERVCGRLLETLTRWLVSPAATDGVLPLWPTDERALTDLVLAMLRPEATGESLTRTAQAFLDRQPQWLSWVIDDAGGVVGGSIAVVNLGHAPALLSTRKPRGVWEAVDMVDPGSMVVFPAPGSDESPSSRVASWEVRLGGRTALLPITNQAIDLTPPGLVIGPFWHDWTLEGLSSGSGRSPLPGSSNWIGGLLHRDPRLDSPASNESGWVLYVETRRPPCGLDDARREGASIDAVRLAFGPSDRPRAELTVRCTGLTTFEVLPPGGGAPDGGALLSASEDRWAFTLPIDQRWLEPDGTILLGVQSMPADGPRATWPRPLLPGQQTIGRVRVDPSTWRLPSRATEINASRPTAR